MITSKNLINGRPATFGDPLQIAAARRHERVVQGKEPATKFEFSEDHGYGIKFKPFTCYNNRCGHQIKYSSFLDVLQDDDEINCPKCNAAYIIKDTNDEDEIDFGLYYKGFEG